MCLYFRSRTLQKTHYTQHGLAALVTLSDHITPLTPITVHISRGLAQGRRLRGLHLRPGQVQEDPGQGPGGGRQGHREGVCEVLQAAEDEGEQVLLLPGRHRGRRYRDPGGDVQTHVLGHAQ